jgi:hypothetical protein
VQFIDGDPDLPLVTGMVYNAAQTRVEMLNTKKAKEAANKPRPWDTRHTLIRDHAGNEIGMDGNEETRAVYLSSMAGGSAGEEDGSYVWLGQSWADRTKGTFGNEEDETLSGVGMYTADDLSLWVRGKKREIVLGNEVEATWGHSFEFNGGTSGEVFVGAKYGFELSTGVELSLGMGIAFSASLLQAEVSLVGAGFSYSAALYEKEFRAGDFEQETTGSAMIRSGAGAKYQSGGDIEIIGGLGEAVVRTPLAATGVAAAGGAAAIAAAGSMLGGYAAGEGSVAGAIAGGVTAAGAAGAMAVGLKRATDTAGEAVDTAVIAAALTKSRIRLKGDTLLLACGQNRIKITASGDIEILGGGTSGIKITSAGVEILGKLTVPKVEVEQHLKVGATDFEAGAPAGPPPLPHPVLTE